LRRAAVVAAGKVRSDREHTEDLMAYYADLVAAKRAGQGLKAA
jgi:alpha-1,6-mannosyltransferase